MSPQGKGDMDAGHTPGSDGRRETTGDAGFDTTHSGEEAVALVRAAMSDAVGLLNVAAAAATAILELTASWEISITLLDQDDYWDIVDVSTVPSRGTRFPDYRYPLTDFPAGTRELLAGRGYTGGPAVEEVLRSYAQEWPDVPVGSILSAPIIALGGVHGEIFLVRSPDRPPFTRAEQDVVTECATMLGARLPALVAAYRAQQAEPSGGGTLEKLNRQLEDLLD